MKIHSDFNYCQSLLLGIVSHQVSVVLFCCLVLLAIDSSAQRLTILRGQVWFVKLNTHTQMMVSLDMPDAPSGMADLFIREAPTTQLYHVVEFG